MPEDVRVKRTGAPMPRLQTIKGDLSMADFHAICKGEEVLMSQDSIEFEDLIRRGIIVVVDHLETDKTETEEE